LDIVKEGEYVRIRFESFDAIFKVVGIYEVLPGIYWTYYTRDSAFKKEFTGIISWDTYEQLIDDNLGEADVVVQNKFIPPENQTTLLEYEDLWGYVRTPLDYEALESVMYQTGAIENSTRRIQSPFYGIPSFEWETNLTYYDPTLNLSDYFAAPAGQEFENVTLEEAVDETLALQDVLWYQRGSIAEDWNSMFSRTEIIDPTTDVGFGNTSIVKTLPEIPIESRESLEAIFEWAEINMPSQNVCVVNELYVNYNLTSGKYNYIKKFSPGENIRMQANESLYTDITIIATTGSHYNYDYEDSRGKHYGDTYVGNYESLSFNSYLAEDPGSTFFLQVIDLEPNTIFLPYSQTQFNLNLTETFIPALMDQYLDQSNNGTISLDNSTTLWWVNQTLANMFSFENESVSGTLEFGSWSADYTYDGSNFVINDTQWAIGGESQESNITYSFPNGFETLQKIVDGEVNFTLDQLTTQVVFDLDDDMTLDEIRLFMETMKNLTALMPTLQNLVFFSPKLYLVKDSGLFNAFFLIGCDGKANIDKTILEIEGYFELQGIDYPSHYIKSAASTEDEVGGILGQIVTMFFGVLAFALAASLLGLAISTMISVKRRYAEIGTLRTLGFSNKQIMKMVVGEGIVTAILGVATGILAGLLVGWLIINNLPFMAFLPIVFTPPYELIASGIGILLVAAVGVSFLPAVSAVRIDIADAIRTKGE